MTAPKLAATRPPALTGRIGLNGENRIHDVALVQALLGLKRAKGGRMYLRDNHVTGKFDRPTAEALMQFRLDHGDRNVKSPLPRSGPILNKLAQGQALAVLEGTATPYKLATLAEPGEAKGEAAKLLSADRKVELHEVMKDFISDWGIALDVEIKVATNNLPPRSRESRDDYQSLPLVAYFSPRNLWVHNGRNLSNLSNSVQFQARAKVLHEAVAADLKSRGAEAFDITDPVDVKIQNGLKNQLASVVRTDLEGVEALAQFYLADWRKKGFTLAVRFLENYLKADKDELSLSQDEALSFPDVQNAVRLNVTRFWQKNLIAPETLEQGFQKLNAISKDREKNELQFTDHWVSPVSSKAFKIWFSRMFDANLDPQTGSIGYGTGGSNLKSTGVFDLRRRGNRIAVTVFVTHEWSDDGYNFDKDAPFYNESQVLERHNKAKTFPWKATWEDVLKWEVEIIDPFTDNATRRMIGFDTMPPDEHISP